MRVTALGLRNFRNFRDLNLEIPPGVVVFHGPNGQGKTNLMEALFFCLRGETFRPATGQSLLRFTDDPRAPLADAARIEAKLIQNDLRHDIQVTISPGRKAALHNGTRVTSAHLARHFPVVLFSPESLLAIKEGPDLRRQLLDDVVLTQSASGAKILKDFRRALQVRNRVLKDALSGRTTRDLSVRLLESLDPSYLPLATELTFVRLKALEELKVDFEHAARTVLHRPDVDISVEYLISGEIARGLTRQELLSAMHNRATELRLAELNSGSSLVGPHKHDIRILFSGKDSRFFCSQGQQRALILSFKMAQILYHYKTYQVYPFLLLDDVLSELDPIRRTNLVGFLADIPAQIFLTTTDLSFSLDFGNRRPSVFAIENGAVTGP